MLAAWWFHHAHVKWGTQEFYVRALQGAYGHADGGDLRQGDTQRPQALLGMRADPRIRW